MSYSDGANNTKSSRAPFRPNELIFAGTVCCAIDDSDRFDVKDWSGLKILVRDNTELIETPELTNQ